MPKIAKKPALKQKEPLVSIEILPGLDTVMTEKQARTLLHNALQAIMTLDLAANKIPKNISYPIQPKKKKGK